MLTPPLLGLVLAGGESRRMGRDKGRLAWQGKELRLRCAELIAPFCGETFLSLRREEPVAGWPVLTDVHPNIGPMAGLLRAFAERPDAAWLVLACDLPLMTRAALQALVAQRDPAALATCLCAHAAEPEPLAAIWEPRAAALLRAAHAGGQYGLQRLLRAQPVHCVQVSFPACLHNANAPADWEAALRHAGSNEHP